MIDMGVRYDDGVDRVGSDRQILPVTLAPFFLALKEPAVHQYLQRAPAVVVNVDQVLGSGDHAGGAEKLYVAQAGLVSLVAMASPAAQRTRCSPCPPPARCHR